MLPLSLLQTAVNKDLLVELRNGDTYNGKLTGCNAFMNICLTDVICTSSDGKRFWKMTECYIHGNSIKYLRVPDEIIDEVPTADAESRDHKSPRPFSGGRGDGAGRGGRGGEGRGRGGDGRGRGGDGRGRGGDGRGRGGEGRGRGGKLGTFATHIVIGKYFN